MIARTLIALCLMIPGTAFAAPKKTGPVTVKGKKTMIAKFETSMGNFSAKLYDDKTPEAVANFVALAEGTKTYTNPQTNKKVVGTPEKPGTPYYDGVGFHRIIDGFMIQGGDPTGTGTGGPGYTIKDEFRPELKYDGPGKLAMAKTNQPNSAGSQFFITVAAASYLTGSYTMFGEIIEGQDVVNAIGKVEVRSERPVKPVTIKHIKIERQ